MDPLSVAASIAGILTLGVQVSKGLSKIITDANAADSLLTELTNDLLILCETLRKMEALTSKWRESAADPLLPGILERCQGSLKELQTMIATVQQSFAKGGLQKRWLQVTWSSKQREIAAISSKISDYKSTLTLTLQMQNASDIGDVKDAIHTFLESKNEHRDMWERRRETMERYRKSTATSFYSVNRAPSYPSSSVCASSGSSFRSRTGSMIFWEPASRDASEPLISPFGDDVTCNGSGNSNLGSSAGSSSSILPLLPPTNLESIQIPPSLLGLDTVDAEQFWSRLAPDLPTASPAPYSTFKERYLNIGPYLWLHGRVWHGDRATSGTLLVTRYSPRSGEIELSRVLLNPPNHESGKTERSWLPPGNDFNRTPEYREAEPTISLESAILGLKIRHHSTYHDGRNVRGPYSFHHISPMSPEQQSSSKESTIWPPIIFPAEDRTTRSLSQQPRPPGDSPRYSLNLFELRKTARGLDRLTGSNIELFSALGPELYTPDIENPLRGIWYWRAFTGYEFMLLRQNSRNQVVGLKLTGSTYIARGARGFGVENTQESGELHGLTAKSLECALVWVHPDYLHLRFLDGDIIHLRRLNVASSFEGLKLELALVKT